MERQFWDADDLKDPMFREEMAWSIMLMDLVFLKEFFMLALIISIPIFILIGWFVWAIQTDGWLVWFLDIGSWADINKKYKKRGWDIPLRGGNRKWT